MLAKRLEKRASYGRDILRPRALSLRRLAILRAACLNSRINSRMLGAALAALFRSKAHIAVGKRGKVMLQQHWGRSLVRITINHAIHFPLKMPHLHRAFLYLLIIRPS